MREIDHVMDDIWHLDHKPIRGGNVIVGGEDTNADGEDPEDARAENKDNIVHGDDGSETDGAENKSARRKRSDRASDGADHAQKGLSEAPEETDPHHDDFRDMNPWLPENNMKFDDPNKESARRRRADHADERAHGLRGDCPTCSGSGSLYGNEDCPVCDGSGDVAKSDDTKKDSRRKRAVDAADEPENTETTKSEDQEIEQQSDEDHKVSAFGLDVDDEPEPEWMKTDEERASQSPRKLDRMDNDMVDEDDSDPDDGFGGKKAPPFEKKDARRRQALRSLADDRADDHLDDDGVNYDSEGEGHSDAYWNSIADDGPDGPPGEDKHSDPFVQRQRDKEKNSRRKALREIASEEPTFSPPNGVSGKWTCNSCGKDVGGVHALNDHVDAHMKTKPAGSGDKESSRRHAGVDNSSMGDYASLNDDNWSLFI